MQDLLLSCDWGTSSFRLRLVDMPGCRILEELISADGVAAVYEQWKDQRQSKTDRQDFYLQQLQQAVSMLAARGSVTLTGCPLVISGMASSSIGMLELPYSNLPFSLSGSDLTVHAMGSKADFLHDVLLISGVRSEQEVMRGEETQMIGLFLSGAEKYPGKGIYILPGTHSKHIAVEEARMTGFESYMTGELFHVLGKYSILKDAVSETRSSALADPANRDAFNRGVLESARHPMLRSLFSVRSNQLFGRMSKEQNGFYLSGLLIGAELAGLQHKSGRIHLCIGNPIHCLYEWGILQLGLADRTEIVPPERMDQAIAAAHVHLFKAYKHGKTRLLQ